MGSDAMVADLKTSTGPPSNPWKGSIYGVHNGVKVKSRLLGRTDRDSLRCNYATQNNMQLQLAVWLFLEFIFKLISGKGTCRKPNMM